MTATTKTACHVCGMGKGTVFMQPSLRDRGIISLGWFMVHCRKAILFVTERSLDTFDRVRSRVQRLCK